MFPPEPIAESDFHSCNQLASRLMKRGIALLENTSPAVLREAVNCFDAAIELRSTLPLYLDPRFRYGLSAGWMNRGDALTRLGSLKDLVEAVHSYDQALKHLLTLPLDEDPLFRKRLAIAWMNRGITLEKHGTEGCLADGAQSFAESIAVLQHENAKAIPELNQMLASVWMNRGNALLSLSEPNAAEARSAAETALKHAAEMERTDVVFAEAGLKTRHVLCRAIAHLLAAPELPAEAQRILVAEATDIAEAGLQLAREWEVRGVDHFRTLAVDLFRFGARVYQAYQPQFLSEFLLENLDSTRPRAGDGGEDLRISAREILWRALAEIQHGAFKTLNTAQFDQFLERLNELQAVERRLNGVDLESFPPANPPQTTASL